MNLVAHWQQIRELESELDEVTYLADDRTGKISKADRETAARLLVTYPHIRQATDGEAARYEAREARRAEIEKAVRTMDFSGIHVRRGGK